MFTMRRLSAVLAAACCLIVVPAAQAKPTIVLVHGAFADASGWNSVIAKLQRAGYPTLAPADPLRGLSSDAASIHSVLATVPGPVILVGHSYGGAVITNAAVGAGNVKALVYISAFAPDQGESALDIVSRFPGSMLSPATLDTRPYPLPDGTTGVDQTIKLADFHAIFAQDLPAREAAVMAVEQRAWSLAAAVEPSGPPAWKTLPSWFLISTKDHAIPPAAQEFMARRAGAHTVKVVASHASLISRPGAVTKLILQAAKAVG